MAYKVGDSSLSAARNQLIKSLLFQELLKREEKCFRCGKSMTIDNYTIDHKEPWRNKPDAVELFFDLENIAYSHLKCNSKATTKNLKPCGTTAAYKRGCRCHKCLKAYAERPRWKECPAKKAARARKNYNSKKRKERYRASIV